MEDKQNTITSAAVEDLVDSYNGEDAYIDDNGDFCYKGVKTNVTLFVPPELRHLTHLQDPLELAYQQEMVQMLMDQPQTESTKELIKQCNTIHKRELLALEKKQQRREGIEQEPNILQQSKKRKFIWSAHDDILILRETAAQEPFNSSHGQVKKAWEVLTDTIRQHVQLTVPLEARQAQDRFCRLIRIFKKDQMASLRKSGKFLICFCVESDLFFVIG